MNTGSRSGYGLTKNFKVYTNDPRQPQTDLIITGKVVGYVEVSPDRVTLTGHPGDVLVREVRILPQKGYPFTLEKANMRTGENIRLELKPLGEKPSESGYLLIITSLRKDPGRFFDHIEVQTDLKEKPTITIPVSGRIYGEPARKN